MKRIRSIQKLAAGAIFSAWTLSAAIAQTPSPTLIPFQGRLTNQANVPYTGGQYTITFNLYRGAVGGTSLWTERHEKVGVLNGMVNVFLGSITTFPEIDGTKPFFAAVKHLGITIDADSNVATADPEMVPRQMIIPAFYAQQAGVATNAKALDGHNWSALFDDGDPTTGKIDAARLANGSITSSQIANASITNTALAMGSVSFSRQANRNVAQSVGGLGDVVFGNAEYPERTGTLKELSYPEKSITITTGGGCLFLTFQGGEFTNQGNAGTATNLICKCSLVRRNTITEEENEILVGRFQSQNTQAAGIPGSSLAYLDRPGSGTFEYYLRVEEVTAGGSNSRTYFAPEFHLVAWEIR